MERSALLALVALVGLGACATYRDLMGIPQPTETPAAAPYEVPMRPTPLLPVEPPPPPPHTEDAARDFARASELYDKGQEREALISLTDFLRRYPQHSLAPEAHFRMGELHFRRAEFSAALIEYRQVLKYTVRATTRIPDATVRLGECLRKIGDSEKAKIEWEATRRRFPGTPAAHRAAELMAGLEERGS